MLKLKQENSLKNKLSYTLRSWLPLLQASSDELEEELAKSLVDNPFIKLKSKKEFNFTNSFRRISNNTTNIIEELNFSKKNIYENLELQINKTIFPTKKSQDIARYIINSLDENGYYIGDSVSNYSTEDIEKIRKRFAYLEPAGVGAKNFKEGLEFALIQANVDDELYSLCKTIIYDLENIKNYTKHRLYKNAINLIKSFKMPPFLDDFEDSIAIIPDIYVFFDNNELKVLINDEYYPEIEVIVEENKLNQAFFKEQLKNAKNLVDALNMRKSTLKKLGLMLIEYQYEYFLGGDIKPMKLQDLAYELDRNASTISRAISNKYLSSNRGTIAIKEFFATQIDGDTSNRAIKDFLINLIKEEDHLKPLSDQTILEIIEKEFSVKMVRRTITKYRKLLDIPSSSERKKLYSLR